MDVSVIIPVFNGAATIASAIESALAQKFDGDFEIVVVNDGSTDGTAKVLASYGDRIKVITQENRGLAAARNAAVRASCGKYVAFLDADDMWHRDKLTKTVLALEAELECGLAYSDLRLVDEAGRDLRSSWVSPQYSRAPSFEDLLRETWPILPSAVVMRRSLFESVGGFSEAFGKICWGEDSLMWVLAREHAPFKFLPEALVDYTVAPAEIQVGKRLAQAVRSQQEGVPLPVAMVAGQEIFIQSLRKRYGARAKGVIRERRGSQVDALIAIGMLVMSTGNARFARDCYLEALRRQPLQLKLPFRLAWTFVPDPLRRPITAILPSRVARALCGPPTM